MFILDELVREGRIRITTGKGGDLVSLTGNKNRKWSLIHEYDLRSIENGNKGQIKNRSLCSYVIDQALFHSPFCPLLKPQLTILRHDLSILFLH